MLSTDAEFKRSGVASGIEYSEDYYKYLFYLRSGLEERRKPIINLFQEWNERFFKTRITTGASKEAQAAFDSAVTNLHETEQVTSGNEDAEEPVREDADEETQSQRANETEGDADSEP
jgi:hypothetical protein